MKHLLFIFILLPCKLFGQNEPKSVDHVTSLQTINSYSTDNSQYSQSISPRSWTYLDIGTNEKSCSEGYTHIRGQIEDKGCKVKWSAWKPENVNFITIQKTGWYYLECRVRWREGDGKRIIRFVRNQTPFSPVSRNATNMGVDYQGNEGFKYLVKGDTLKVEAWHNSEENRDVYFVQFKALLLEGKVISLETVEEKVIPNNKGTVLDFPGADSDYVKESGWYIVEARVTWESNSTGNRFLKFKKNGTTEVAPVKMLASSGRDWQRNTFFLYLNASEKIQVVVQQSSGENLTVKRGRLKLYKTPSRAQKVSLYNTAESPISNDWTTVENWEVISDKSNLLDSENEKLVFRSNLEGWYLFFSHIRWDTNADGSRNIQFYRFHSEDGTGNENKLTNSGKDWQHNVHLFFIKKDDTIGLQVKANPGANLITKAYFKAVNLRLSGDHGR